MDGLKKVKKSNVHCVIIGFSDYKNNRENLDKAVKAAYRNKGFETEEEIVASLMKLYKEAVDKEKPLVE